VEGNRLATADLAIKDSALLPFLQNFFLLYNIATPQHPKHHDQFKPSTTSLHPPSTSSIIHIMPRSSTTMSNEDVLHPLLHEAPPPEETLLESVTFPVRYGTQTSLKSKSKDCYNIIKFFMSGKGKYFHLFDICLIMKHLCKFPDFLPFVPEDTAFIPLSPVPLSSVPLPYVLHDSKISNIC
jgi:hypothetical protein